MHGVEYGEPSVHAGRLSGSLAGSAYERREGDVDASDGVVGAVRIVVHHSSRERINTPIPQVSVDAGLP